MVSSGQTCETNQFGEMKYHYCDKRYGEGNTACIRDRPPPMKRECKRFFADVHTPNNVPADLEEIVIEDVKNKRKTYCWNKTNPENAWYGWCKTKGK